MLLAFFEWCEGTLIGETVRNSLWLFPVLEAIHLLGLAMLGGAVLLVDLRMLGIGLTRQGVSELSHQVRPWLTASVVILLATGIPLFLSEAIKCYYNTSFWVKMVGLAVALLFTYLVRERVARVERVDDVTPLTRTVGTASMALWFIVAAAGRWIGFS